MKSHVFDRQLYDECCGWTPSFTKDAHTAPWQAVCKNCGRTVKAEKPGDLPIAWNRDVRKDSKK